MDIMRPPLNQRGSPVPWIVVRNNVDVPSLIAGALIQTVDASADDVVKQLRKCGLQVSGIVVSMWLSKWTTHSGAVPTAVDQASGCQMSQTPEVELYCKCDQQLCTRGKSRSPRWQGYYCGVRLTANQKKVLDEFFNRASSSRSAP